MIIPRRNELPQPCFSVPQMEPRLNAPTPGMLINWGLPVQGPKPRLSADRAERDDRGPGAEAIACMEKLGFQQQYPSRTPIFHYGDPALSVYVVRRGKLKLSLLSRKGRSVVFRLAGPGDLLGISAILNHTDHQFLSETIEPCALVNVPRTEFLQLLQTVPEVNTFATQSLARDHDAMLRAIRRLGMSASVRERLAQLLLSCAESSLTNNLPLSVRINWTYGELGDMVNSSRETVTRIMTQFEREELIVRRGSLVVIRNQTKLQILAG